VQPGSFLIWPNFYHHGNSLDKGLTSHTEIEPVDIKTFGITLYAEIINNDNNDVFILSDIHHHIYTYSSRYYNTLETFGINAELGTWPASDL
jgi:hypothetical protein